MLAHSLGTLLSILDNSRRYIPRHRPRWFSTIFVLFRICFFFTRSSMVILCTRAPCLCHLESSCLHHTLDLPHLCLYLVHLFFLLHLSSIGFTSLPSYLLPISTPQTSASATDLPVPSVYIQYFSATIGIITTNRSMRFRLQQFFVSQDGLFLSDPSLLGQSDLSESPPVTSPSLSPLPSTSDKILKHSQRDSHNVQSKNSQKLSSSFRSS
jgi:hypothetical protein